MKKLSEKDDSDISYGEKMKIPSNTYLNISYIQWRDMLDQQQETMKVVL